MSEQRPKLRLSGAAGVLEALRSNDLGLRISVCQALSAKPEKARDYASQSGGELLACLRQSLSEAPSQLERHALLAALCGFAGAELFWDEFGRTSELETLLLLAHRLGREPAEWLLPTLVSGLEHEEHPTRRQVLANMLAAQTGLPDEVSLEVAVLASLETPSPPVKEELWPLWLRHLEGPYQQKARSLFQASGQAAEGLLVGHWKDLSTSLKVWAAGLLDVDDQAVVSLLLADAGTAVIAVDRLASSPTRLWAVWESLWQAGDEPLRAALVLAGCRVDDPVAEFCRAGSKELQVALLSQWPESAPWEETIVKADWKVRAAALDRLRALGSPPEVTRGWLDSGDESLVVVAMSLGVG